MIPVNSSNLQAVEYDPLTGTLTIQFHSGRIYEYHNVPQHIYDGLMTASSKGGYHHKYIRNSYSYTRIQ